MLKEAIKEFVPEPLLELGDIRELFLNEDQPIENQEEKLQKALEAIWKISSIYYPDKRVGETTLSLPSQRLVDLGLVSEKTIMELEQRASVEEGYEDRNTTTIEKTNQGFSITERYRDAEGFYRVNGHIARLDYFAEEKTFLQRDESGKINIMMLGRRVDPHLHAFKKTWYQNQEEGNNFEFEVIEINPRRINTTLALLVEGTHPGFIKNSRTPGFSQQFNNSTI